MHAFLDSSKSTWEQLEYRVQYYEMIITETLRALNVPIDKLKFVKGTDFQLSKKYTIDVYKLMSKMSLRDALKAGTEVVKQSKNPQISSLLYPGLQVLDEEYLGVDAQLGGIDQRKIFMLAKKYLPQLGYKERIHLMNPIIPSFSNKTCKMSSSDISSKIDLLSTEKQIIKKINKAYCVEGENNALLIFVKYVIFPIIELHDMGNWIIPRPILHGGELIFKSYDELNDNFLSKKLHPSDLKLGIHTFLNKLLCPVRKYFADKDELIKSAYP
jgi:tyrosyl-tRNA synthetase